MTRDSLLKILQAKGIMARRYFHPGVHEIPPFSGKQWVLPVTDRLCQSLIQLPTGQTVTERDVEGVCAAVRAAAAT
jgi:dTDP-4-amino-4,6-dideoxygalactose transaminase